MFSVQPCSSVCVGYVCDPFIRTYLPPLCCATFHCSTVVEFSVAHKESGHLVNGTVVLERLQPYLGGGALRGVTIKRVDTKGLYMT